MKTKKLTTASLLIALGVIAGNVIYIPVGASKCFPVQHTLNVLSAVVLGPWYGVGIAFCVSLLRNILGTGSLLAFPGSMIGALLAGMFYWKFKNVFLAAAGEIIGTGILGGLVAFPVAKLLMGKDIAATFFIAPFLLSTIGGSILAVVLVKSLKINEYARKHMESVEEKA